MKIKNIVGQTVRGEDFFDRPKEIRKIWNVIESGSHILISAPRRVGKTSILFYLKDNPKEKYHFFYVITESINSEDEFYKRLFKEIVKSDFISNKLKALKATSDFVRNLTNKIERFKVAGIEVELDKSEDVNYKNEFIHLLKLIQLDDDKIIIMIDEFPQTIENIINHSNENEAIHFLQSNREIRQDTEINNNVQFIYTGSIGLENIVSKLNAINLINDLNNLTVKSLTKDRARELIHSLLENKEFEINDDRIEYLLNQIEWFIPFYIQLFIQEIHHIHIEETPQEITNATIDLAFERMLEHRNHFEHWQTRLRKAFKKEEYKFAKETLNLISKQTTAHSDKILNLAVKRNIEDRYKDIMRTLIHDGYINNNDERTIYRFNSPILKLWWYKNVAN